MAGIERRKLNVNAFSLLKPSSKAIETVIPLLESPGKIARPWLAPMMRDVVMVTVSLFSFPILDV